jgi:uncharacterized protein YciI
LSRRVARFGRLAPMKHVLLYQPVDNVLELAPLHFEAHNAWALKFHAAGTLLMYGTFGDPASEGAMAIFTSREAADAFVADDPFMVNGVVARHEIREWDEVLSR